MAGVWSDDGSGNPNAELFTLTKPTNIVAATSSGGPITLSVTGNYVMFTAPPNTTLDPSTTYHMVLEGGSGNLLSTAIDDETGATGWSIANAGHRKQTPPTPGNWEAVNDHHDASNAMLIRVNGTTGGTATTTAAMGAPTITGTAQVGETLTAVTTGITDADGLTSVSYTYQWIRVDGTTEADIAGANSSTYTLDAADLGKTIKVKVSFTDDASNAETLTSAETATVAAAIILPVSGGLVSNLNQEATTDAVGFGNFGTRNLVAQGFTTGANPGGYTLTSIEVAFDGAQTTTQLGDLTAGVWSDDGSGNPNAELFMLTKPASIAAATFSGSGATLSVTGNYTVFTAPANTTLDPSRTYHVVLAGGGGNLWSTAIDDETGATGWSIADGGHKKETAPTPGNWGGGCRSRRRK